jgi:hypothetical protein
VYPVRTEVAGAVPTTGGRFVFLEPEVATLAHSDEPNLRLVWDGKARWLEATRAIAPGEALTLDRSVPLDLPTQLRRPRACGRGPQVTVRRSVPPPGRRTSGAGR